MNLTLLTDGKPFLLGDPDETILQRVRLLKEGVEKSSQGEMRSETLGDLPQAVLVEFAGRFRAGLRPEDPATDVPIIKVQLLSAVYSGQAGARRAAPHNAR